jgi:hypothetical protein
MYLVEYLNAVFPAYGYFETEQEVAEFADKVMFPKARQSEFGGTAEHRQRSTDLVRAYPLKKGGDEENKAPKGFDFKYANWR